MANKIEEVETSAQRFVNSTSRYVKSKVIRYGDNHKLTFKTYKKQEITSNPADKFAVVPPGMEYRPDLVSYKAYGVPDFWWRIMEANNIKDILDFKAGMTIRIPGAFF